MKQRVLLFVVLFMNLGCVVRAQEAITQRPTTEEEFNYLTKGYKIQIESGLDMKKGYSLVDLSPEEGFTMTFSDPQKGTIIRGIKYKALVRDGEERPCAILCIAERKDTGYKNYLCIPSISASAEMWNKAMSQFQNEDDVWKNVHVVDLCKLVSLLSYAMGR